MPIPSSCVVDLKCEAGRGVMVRPRDVVRRCAFAWDGMVAEIVETTTRERLEFDFRGPPHLLAVYEQGTRREGDTIVDGLPRSKLRDVARKLTFVPAGHAYHEWHEPCGPTRIIYLHFDPARMPAHPEKGVVPASLAPRLFFEDATLTDTALKIGRLVENADLDDGHYLEALGAVLAHELVRLNAGTPRSEALAKGGLAAWQQRAVTTYIEEHLAEPISLANSRAAGSLESVLFLPRLQAFVRPAAASLPQQPSHRARQAFVGATHVFGDGYRADCRIWRDELIHRGVPQDDRHHANGLSPNLHTVCRQRDDPSVGKGDPMKMHIVIAAMAASLLGANLALAQVGGAGNAPMGATSPFALGAGSPAAPVGIPLGATEMATPGISPAPPPTMGAMGCTGMGGPTSQSTAPLFDGGGMAAASGACASTGSAGASMPAQSMLSTGRANIPLGSTELGNAGLSPAPSVSTMFVSPLGPSMATSPATMDTLPLAAAPPCPVTGTFSNSATVRGARSASGTTGSPNC